MIVVQIYVDDIIFYVINDSLCDHFSKCMNNEFDISMMRELNFFLRLQIKQSNEGIFINQSKYINDLLKRFELEIAKPMKTSMSSTIKLDKDENDKAVDIIKYRGMIGYLLYIMACRSDIMFSV